MSALSKVLRSVADEGLMFLCNGCKKTHLVRYGDNAGPKWQWNGNVDKPTFTPSILVRHTELLVSAEEIAEILASRPPSDYTALPHKDVVCHSIITDGYIYFLPDSTHELAGQTVALLEW